MIRVCSKPQIHKIRKSPHLIRDLDPELEALPLHWVFEVQLLHRLQGPAAIARRNHAEPLPAVAASLHYLERREMRETVLSLPFPVAV